MCTNFFQTKAKGFSIQEHKSSSMWCLMSLQRDSCLGCHKSLTGTSNTQCELASATVHYGEQTGPKQGFKSELGNRRLYFSRYSLRSKYKLFSQAEALCQISAPRGSWQGGEGLRDITQEVLLWGWLSPDLMTYHSGTIHTSA